MQKVSWFRVKFYSIERWQTWSDTVGISRLHWLETLRIVKRTHNKKEAAISIPMSGPTTQTNENGLTVKLS